MAKNHERGLALTLFVEAGLLQKEISERLDVSEKTISKWKELDNWDTLKASAQVTRSKTLQSLYIVLHKISEENIEKQRGGNLEYKDIHKVNELASAIEKLQMGESLSAYIQAFTNFLNWLKEVDLDLAKKVAARQNEFLLKKSKEL